VLLQITCYSIVTNVFKENMEKYIALLEVALMLGEGLGPFIGAAVQPSLGYANTMYLFGIFNGIGLIVCVIFTPSVLNKTVSDKKIE
jgi:predicted MFS family arabinose efflux permease